MPRRCPGVKRCTPAWRPNRRPSAATMSPGRPAPPCRSRNARWSPPPTKHTSWLSGRRAASSPASPGLRAGLGLRLLAQRKPAPRQDRGGHRRQHVGLILGRIGAPRDQADPVAAADAGVVAGGDPRRSDAVGERRQGREPERPVAAHARVGRAPRAEPGYELLHHLVVELLAQVEADVRHAERVTGRPRRPHRLRRAAGALAVGRAGVDPQPQGDADRLEAGLDRLQQRDRRVDAARHRHRHAAGDDGHPRRVEGGRERPVQGIGGEGDARAVALPRREHRLELRAPDRARRRADRGPAPARRRARRRPSRAGRRSCGGERRRCGPRPRRARSGSRRRTRCPPPRRQRPPVRPIRRDAGRAHARSWRRSTRGERRWLIGNSGDVLGGREPSSARTQGAFIVGELWARPNEGSRSQPHHSPPTHPSLTTRRGGVTDQPSPPLSRLRRSPRARPCAAARRTA